MNEEALERLREIAFRDEAKSVTVRNEDLRAAIEALDKQRAESGGVEWSGMTPEWDNRERW